MIFPAPYVYVLGSVININLQSFEWGVCVYTQNKSTLQSTLLVVAW